MNLDGVGIWSLPLGYGDPGESADAAAELEELGFSALWIPDIGGPLFEAVDVLLGATQHLIVNTGILNIWIHTPDAAAEHFSSLSRKHGHRLMLGVGVSHAPVLEPGRYRRPLEAMADFLDGLDRSATPVPIGSRVLAALGPKMLGLAKGRSRGVHPYLVAPEHTRLARQVLGPEGLVSPEQTVILCSGREEARTIGAGWLRQYLSLPNYANSVLRLGFEPDDIESISDRLFDALIAWGDEDAILKRIDEHHAAGANHVCLQVLTADLTALPRPEWRRIAAAI